ncbi:MAG: Holliday junction resolvase Hjc [Candidatus Aenigmatarchaeota archaeon]
MVKAYSKGYRLERKLVHLLSDRGYMVMRSPRSGRMNVPAPDIVAVKNGRVFVIECKNHANAFTVEKGQLDQLRAWVDKAGATAYVAWNMPKTGLMFLKLDDVAANNGNIGKKFAMEKGTKLDTIEN